MAQLLLDAGKGFLSGSRSIDEFDSLGFPLGEGAITVGNFFVETKVEVFDPIFLAGGARAAESTAAGFGGIEIENQGEIRFAVGDGEMVDKVNCFNGESAGIALEDGGGVVKAVGNDPFSSGEGGMNELAHEFGSARGKKEEFGFGGHGLSNWIVFQEMADGFADWGATGFTDFVNGEVGGAKPSEGGGYLGAFAAPFAPFESNETTWGGHSGTSRAATARAAMPSPRPMKPSFSLVVALMLTRSTDSPRAAAIFTHMAGKWGRSFGASASRVASTLRMVAFFSLARRADSAKKRVLATFFHFGSVLGKWAPISPAPRAPRTASVRA